MSGQWHVHLAGWMRIAWALDEDLRQVQAAVAGRARWTTLPRARIVQAAWPTAVTAIPSAALRGKTVVCQADNPPAFYLGTEEFARAAAVVDLWVARSREALRQFALLGLPAVLAPYAVDPGVFRPLPDRMAIRRSLGIADGDFVIGNFHRDSEGADLRRPKMQKGPDILRDIARRAAGRIPGLTVLLAGPRRHWLASALKVDGIRVVFGGPAPGGDDDYGTNIVPRPRLNELYHAMDCCVVSSRWEGGPYAVLEALFAERPVISAPVGQARDVLPGECLFGSAEEAADMLARHARSGALSAPCADASRGARVSHAREALGMALLEAYRDFTTGPASLSQAARSAGAAIVGRLRSGAGDVHPHVAKWSAAVAGRAAQGGEPPGLIEFPMEGDISALLETAAGIAVARKS
jgi:glycosyltransferase involved in cell wall biosynthesis